MDFFFSFLFFCVLLPFKYEQWWQFSIENVVSYKSFNDFSWTRLLKQGKIYDYRSLQLKKDQSCVFKKKFTY